MIYSIYFRLKFGLVNSINTYSRLKIRFVLGRIFDINCVGDDKIQHTKSDSDLYLYIKPI